jgi:hypothetical protein
LVWTFYLLPERREGATGEQGTSSRRRQQELQYRTEQRQEGGWEREGGSYAKPERERAVKDKTEQSGFFNKGREREERKGREKSRAGPQMPSLVVVDDVS